MNKSSGSSLNILDIWTPSFEALALGLSSEDIWNSFGFQSMASEQEWMTKGYKDRAQTSCC